ncbi:MAG: radical SAM protein [Chitinophagaceae bacterium]|nr:radical SAM protein [Chitinophagaceae bacterium]
MQTLVQPLPGIRGKDLLVDSYTSSTLNQVTGLRQKFIRKLIWLNILLVATRLFRNPIVALKKVSALKALRNRYRNDKPLPKYARSGNRYFVNFNTPGWPSPAFNRYVSHYLRRHGNVEGNSLSTLIFAITKKCGFQCEHCCEWLNLNKPETLSRENLLSIVNRFHQLGIAQVQLSGGEPLNRYKDILFLLDNAPKGVDFWIYTTGHSLNAQKARQLKRRGLTGITISLDHHQEAAHNTFRGVDDAYQKAMAATAYARNAGLATCFSLCATRAFISEENLKQYMELARRMGVSFVQVLEPKAVGHYAGMDVGITIAHQQMIEGFYQKYNYDPAYSDYPAIAYHGYTTREFGCTGSGADYVYADTDGDIHNCPFCQRKLFSALDPSLPELIQQMKTKGCSAFSSCSTKN